MAFGGGAFTAQNKTLPGAYINFVSAANASSALSDRGIATIALPLNWGVDDKVFTVTASDFKKNSNTIFGYSVDADELKPVREIFKNAITLHCFRLNGGGKQAECTFAKAKYTGTRGNDIAIVIEKNVDEQSKFDVKTVFDNKTVDTQIVAKASELVDNDFVTFISSANLIVTAKTALTGGTNGTADGESHQKYLDKIERYSFNAMGVATEDDSTKELYISFCKRLRDEVGKKFQLVVYNKKADYEGVVNLKNDVTDGATKADLVYWVTGLIAGVAVNKSCTNTKYDGEYTVNVDYTQAQLEQAIKDGEFTLQQSDDNICVLSDINSLVTVTVAKGDDFKSNQTIRVLDQIANDIAVMFNTRYLGIIPNDRGGRNSLWKDIVKHHKELEQIRAIEDFNSDTVIVEQGDTKKSVVVTEAVTPVNAMEQLYMTVTVQ